MAEWDSLLMSCLLNGGPEVRILSSPPPDPTRNRHRARSSTDRASDYGSEGWGFESLRAHQQATTSGWSPFYCPELVDAPFDTTGGHVRAELYRVFMTTTHHVGDPCWMELASPDPAAAEEFYGPLFGWEFADVNGRDGYRLITSEGRPVGGLRPANERAKGWLPYLKVRDLRGTLIRVLDEEDQLMVAPAQVGALGVTAVIGVQGVIGLWQPGTVPGACWDDGPGTPAWVDLSTFDVAETERFYRRQLRWRISTRYEPVVTMGGPPFYAATNRASAASAAAASGY